MNSKRVNVAISEHSHSVARHEAFIKQVPIGKLVSDYILRCSGSKKPAKRKKAPEIVYGGKKP